MINTMAGDAAEDEVGAAGSGSGGTQERWRGPSSQAERAKRRTHGSQGRGIFHHLFETLGKLGWRAGGRLAQLARGLRSVPKSSPRVPLDGAISAQANESSRT
uniref:Uncharacterized protein n=1 Tax=Knipowitschia caucasica TaxID=637954 RepID=A0AAV2KQM1_KNICA